MRPSQKLSLKMSIHLVAIFIASFSMIQFSHANSEDCNALLSDSLVNLFNRDSLQARTHLLEKIHKGNGQKLQEEVTQDLQEMLQVVDAELRKTSPLMIYQFNRRMFIRLQRALASALKNGIYYTKWLELSIYYAVAMDIKEQIGYDGIKNQVISIDNAHEYYHNRVKDLKSFIEGYQSVLSRNGKLKPQGNEIYNYVLLVPSHTDLVDSNTNNYPYVFEMRITSSTITDGSKQIPPSQRMFQDLERAYFFLVNLNGK